jgi:hypothetical protein
MAVLALRAGSRRLPQAWSRTLCSDADTVGLGYCSSSLTGASPARIFKVRGMRSALSFERAI